MTTTKEAVSDEEARRALDRLDTLEKTKPSAPQLGRYGALGGVTGAAMNVLGNTIRGKPITPRDLAAGAVTGALGMGALPLVRTQLDRQAETGTLKRYVGERVAEESPKVAGLLDELDKLGASEKELRKDYERAEAKHLNAKTPAYLAAIGGAALGGVLGKRYGRRIDEGLGRSAAKSFGGDAGVGTATGHGLGRVTLPFLGALGGSAKTISKTIGDLVAPAIGLLKAAKKDQLPGGLADEKSPNDFPAAALREGEKVEKEHTSNSSMAREIAMDHLTEDKEYYGKLKQVEKKAFQTSMYSGPLSYGPFKQHSHQPGYRHPQMAAAPVPAVTGQEKKAATPLTPAGRLVNSSVLGKPKLTAPAGPSIHQIAKPPGIGTKLPGAGKGSNTI